MIKLKIAFVAILMLFLTSLSTIAQSNNGNELKNNTMENYPIHYKTIKAGGLNIFYREAGPESAPVILLMHGYPTSSVMFRNLIPILSVDYHVIAPDMPGFGFS